MAREYFDDVSPLSHLIMVLQAPRPKSAAAEKRLQECIETYLDCSQGFAIEDRPVWIEGRHGHA